MSTNFRRKGAVPNDSWCQRNLRVPGLSRGVVCVILSSKFSRFDTMPAWRVTHTHTHTDRHTMMANTSASLAPCA